MSNADAGGAIGTSACEPATSDSGRLASFRGKMPRIGLGLAALGRPGYITSGRAEDLGEARSEAEMRIRTEEVLDTAWAAGVRWFDVARSYGLAEDFVGTWLRSRGLSPDNVCVSSKWGYRYTADWRVDTAGTPHEVKDHSDVHFASQLPETLAACGEFVRLYQVHSATFESGVLADTPVHMALGTLRRERGWHLGLSLSGTQQSSVLDAALLVEDPSDERQSSGSRRTLFDAVQVTYNVLEQAPHQALIRAHAAGVQIIVKEALANGRAMSCPALAAAAADEGVTADQLAIACVLAQPFEPFVLSGAVTPAQLRSNLQADELAAGLRDKPARLAELMAACRQESSAYWADRSALPWS